jgi:hypothetical protein
MAQFRLEGTCNRCGLCCLDGDLRCHYLEVSSLGVGVAMGTRCRVHASRFPGMPIIMIDVEGKVAKLAACAHGTPQDDIEIMAKGIGKGCSLRVVNG